MGSQAKLFVALGALLAAAAVAAGAFGAHALKAKLAPDLLAVYRTAVEYHFYHALGLILVGAVAARMPDSSLVAASGWTMLGGIVLFSGSLYVLVLAGIPMLGAVTPLGGVAFIAGWLCLVAAALR